MKKKWYRGVALVLGALAFATAYSSCSSGGGSGFVKASGRPGEVMLVIENKHYDTYTGSLLLNMLEAPAPSLPQNEPSYSVSHVTPGAFTDFVRYFRNIFIVDVDAERFSINSLKYGYDEWASGQLVMRLQSPSLDSVNAYVKANSEAMTNMIARHEFFRLAQVLRKDYSQRALELVDSTFAYQLNVPRDIRSSKVGKDFVWLSNNAIRRRHDILVYSYPYTSSESIGLDEMVARRDSVLRENIVGEFEGSYPATEKFYGLLHRKVTTKAGGLRGELRGLWKMEGGSMMGGPFVCQAYVDKEAGKVYVIEGFVYHPNEEKLPMVRMIEASLYSFRPRTRGAFDPQDILTASYTKFF